MRKSLILIFLLTAFAAPAPAGWSEDMRLTDRYFEIHPQVIARNDTIHVIWFRLLVDDVSYLRSTDAGQTWDSLIVLTEPDHRSVYADLSLGGNGLLVSWQDNGPNNEETIAIATSIDGSIWNDPLYVFTDNMHHFTLPASTVKGDSIFIVYRSYRADSTGDRPFRFMYSYDYGMSWSDESSIGYAPSNVQDLLTCYCDGMILAAWAGFPDTVHSGYHVIGYASSDAGQTWSDSIWISPHSPYSAQNPCIACNEETGQIAVGYMDYRYQEYAFHGDIFIAISNDGGLTWPREMMATESHAAWDPSIDFEGDTLVVVWSDRQFYDDGQHEIMFNRSDNGGMTWQGEYRLTYAMGESFAPWLTMDSSELFAVWWENGREGGYEAEIYYKRYTPDPTAVEDDRPIFPAVFSMSAYPNPFNSSTAITYSGLEGGEIEIYNIGGQKIRTLDTTTKEGKIIWDARDALGNEVSSGIYFARVKTSQNSETLKLLYLK